MPRAAVRQPALNQIVAGENIAGENIVAESNTRGRDRVPVEIAGIGEVIDQGRSFAFTAVDFSVQGLSLRTREGAPQMGDRVRLSMELSGGGEEFKSVALVGEVVRCVQDDGDTVCGVNWLENENSQNLEELESFYMERFFDMIG